MRKIVITGFTVIFLIITAGCTPDLYDGSNNTNDDAPYNKILPAPGERKPAIFIDGVIYLTAGRVIAGLEIDESDYNGVVTSVVSREEMPAKDGESNMLPLGTPYVKYEDGIAAFPSYLNQWELYLPYP